MTVTPDSAWPLSLSMTRPVILPVTSCARAIPPPSSSANDNPRATAPASNTGSSRLSFAFIVDLVNSFARIGYLPLVVKDALAARIDRDAQRVGGGGARR